jgi:hypothetical protein
MGHYKWVPHVKAIHLLTTLQGRASDVLHGDLKVVMYGETIGATEDRFGDQHLPAWYCNQPKTWTQEDGESLPEFATTID